MLRQYRLIHPPTRTEQICWLDAGIARGQVVTLKSVEGVAARGMALDRERRWYVADAYEFTARPDDIKRDWHNNI